jgi:hypothetical protein
LEVIVVVIGSKPAEKTEGVAEPLGDEDTDPRSADLGHCVGDNGGRCDEGLATLQKVSTLKVQTGGSYVDCIDNPLAVVVMGGERLGAVEVAPDRQRQVGVGAPDVYADEYAWEIVHVVLRSVSLDGCGNGR